MSSKLLHYLPLFGLLFIFISCADTGQKDNVSSSEAVKALHVKKVRRLLKNSAHLDSLLRHGAEEAEVQEAFKQTRLAYKHTETLLEYYNPELAKKLNGPAIDKHDLHAAERKVWHATGFQVVEETIFPEYDQALQEEAATQMGILHGFLSVYQNDLEGLLLSDSNIFEALRLELLRIMSLGISGFDSPVAFYSLEEAKAALQGMEDILDIYFQYKSQDSSVHKLKKQFEDAKSYLTQSDNFDKFNRLTFIKKHIDAISQELYAFQKLVEVPNNSWATAINLEEGSFFSPNTFNTDFFAPPFNRNNKPEVVALGKVLFNEPMLSGNNSRSCASCHQADKAFSDGMKKSMALDGHSEIQRNAPTIINSTFQRLQFYDSRMNFLEGQIADVVANPEEMHGSVEEAASKLAMHKEYRDLFTEAFDEDSITAKNLQRAIAAYVRSLNGLNAPFDQYMRGDTSAMTKAQIHGFNLFMGKAKCATCHFLPLFNGTVPPAYLDTESEVLGVPAESDTANAVVDPDLGKYEIYGGELLKFAFKTPTVRNAALTAPYMHNGVYATLEEVIDFYNRGGGAGIGITLEHQTLPPDPLNLSQQEQQDLVSFLHALTDTTGLTAPPKAIVVPQNIALKR